MARTDTLGNFLTDVADAIREKKGTSEAIIASDFDTEIASIPSGGGDIPEKGAVFTEWNSNGFPTKARVVGLTTIPAYYLSSGGSGFLSRINTIDLPSTATVIDQNAFYYNSELTTVNMPNTLTAINQMAFRNCSLLVLTSLPSSLTTLQQFAFTGCSNISLTSLPEGITKIGQYTFQNCTKLALTSLPSGLTQLDTSAFQNCSKLNITSIPEGVQRISTTCFYSCSNLKKIYMNPTQIDGGNSSGGAFQYCSNLKQVWIGSNITSIGRYAFYKCNKLEKMYINLPRATVEAITNYQYAFMSDESKTGIIVCNDDSDFITKEEFDELVVE